MTAQEEREPRGRHRAETPGRVRHVIGVMTGTSIDGIDVAMARIEGSGLEMRAVLMWHDAAGLVELGPRLRRAAEQEPMPAREFAKLAWDFGVFHAEVIADCLKKRASEAAPDLIVAHGQTVFHQPPVSWQLLNPAPIAARFDCPVACDLRQADLAAGGQGAPITPLADWILFRDEKNRRAIVNLGGFCNVTILPRAVPPPSQRGGQGVGRAPEDEAVSKPERVEARSHNPLPDPPPQRGREPIRDIRGFDVCACNHILDTVAVWALNRPYDKDGGAAVSGHVNSTASGALHRILTQQRMQRRSLGTRDEATAWFDAHRPSLPPNDLAATAVDAIARCIADAVKEHEVDEFILAGGGALNRAVVESIRAKSALPVQLSDALDVPVQAREALAMAVLGALQSDGVPITLPHVTGRDE